MIDIRYHCLFNSHLQKKLHPPFLLWPLWKNNNTQINIKYYNQPTTTTFNIGISMYKTWLNDNCQGESSIFRRSRIQPGENNWRTWHSTPIFSNLGLADSIFLHHLVLFIAIYFLNSRRCKTLTSYKVSVMSVLYTRV